MNKKNFYAPSAWRLGGASVRRAATALLLCVMTMTVQTAWADTETVSYIDADGAEQTVTATVLTGDVTADGLSTDVYGDILIPAGWYVVKNSKDGVDASYTAQLRYTGDNGTIHLILADGAEMTVSESTSSRNHGDRSP